MKNLVWHVSSRSGVVLVAQTAICFLTVRYEFLKGWVAFFHILKYLDFGNRWACYSYFSESNLTVSGDGSVVI